MNDMVKFSGGGTGLATRDDMVRGLNNMAMEAPRVGGDYQFLKLDKGNGDWLYGQEETPVEDGSLWAANPASLMYGYIAWDDNSQVEGEVMVPITRPLPTDAELRVKGTPDGRPSGKNGWQFQQSVVLVCISGEDSGIDGKPPVQALYKQSSVGSQKLFKGLSDAIAAQLVKGSDAIVPIIEMKSDSYKHKKYGKIFNPIFEIKEWRTMDDGSAPAPDAAPAAAEAPARQRRAAAPTPPAEGSAEEDAALEAEYKQAEAETATPRRRVRR